jgi:hypothetical protein
MTEGDRLRDDGMARATDAESAPFKVLAYNAIISVAHRKGTVHVDDVLAVCTAKATHPNCWGSIWSKAKRNGVIELTSETRKCDSDSGKHSHVYPVYRSLIFGSKP